MQWLVESRWRTVYGQIGLATNDFLGHGLDSQYFCRIWMQEVLPLMDVNASPEQPLRQLMPCNSSMTS
jgi:hypothetical protein